ncbi:hypothetical protein K378_01363 [Streptomyces sp. Amel2xB2]|uniref:XRE family transcriptional regulator n=1 Tax=Streptomyces sp. Amel2xB2 TaxID=1305829 RepID=UPI000DB94762|nr:XRE family transcriptional regulator [Streptomyces sp. Amel2xB2]RAJ70198.1 hypothetical protein K378_01363 [Streptomyces sp. Amel2xB2]
MPELLRKGDGQPIRTAMHRAGLTGPALAEATKHVDDTGKGISPATVGKLSGTGKSARGTTRLRTAWLMATALRTPLQELFYLPGVSPVTEERSTSDGSEDAR